MLEILGNLCEEQQFFLFTVLSSAAVVQEGRQDSNAARERQRSSLFNRVPNLNTANSRQEHRLKQAEPRGEEEPQNNRQTNIMNRKQPAVNNEPELEKEAYTYPGVDQVTRVRVTGITLATERRTHLTDQSSEGGVVS